MNHRYPEDIVGRIIQVGDVIAYAVSVNSSGVLNIGKVTGLPVHVETTGQRMRDSNGNWYWHSEQGTYNKIKLQPWDLVNDRPEFQNKYNPATESFEDTGKPVPQRTIQYSNRAVVIKHQ